MALNALYSRRVLPEDPALTAIELGPARSAWSLSCPRLVRPFSSRPPVADGARLCRRLARDDGSDRRSCPDGRPVGFDPFLAALALDASAPAPDSAPAVEDTIDGSAACTSSMVPSAFSGVGTGLTSSSPSSTAAQTICRHNVSIEPSRKMRLR